MARPSDGDRQLIDRAFLFSNHGVDHCEIFGNARAIESVFANRKQLHGIATGKYSVRYSVGRGCGVGRGRGVGRGLDGAAARPDNCVIPVSNKSVLAPVTGSIE
jgi:hypothetical protein